ncbi:hypothetical protein MMYC01_201526 [Madurella mycetomatis]|uniref:SUR7 family protein pun1 n=1 Tax=Madurella mycetomatis TaxID=100816 RepID=A0A175WE90_9PEZI|nr:hypothetical protein MMYC01_201526 [Madurella mycetomatis]
MRGLSGGGGSAVDIILKVSLIVCSFLAFLSLAIALSSGMSENYLEELSVINFNTSTLGKNLIQVPDTRGDAKDGCGRAERAIDGVSDDAGGFFGDAESFLGSGGAMDATEDACNEGTENDKRAGWLPAASVDEAEGSVAEAIGIQEYYSLHIGVLCSGRYDPHFNEAGAKPDIRECTQKFNTGQTDLSRKLDEELGAGPFQLGLSELRLSTRLREALDLLPRVLTAMTFFYFLAVLALAAGFLFSAATLVFEYALHDMQGLALLGSLGFTGFGWFVSATGAIGITAVAEQVKNVVNEEGATFGMSAATSPELYFLLWASLVLATAALAMLFLVWFRMQDDTDAAYVEPVDAEKDIWDDAADPHGFYPEPVEGSPRPNSFGTPPLPERGPGY